MEMLAPQFPLASNPIPQIERHFRFSPSALSVQWPNKCFSNLAMTVFIMPKRHILVVDDDALVRETVTMLLQFDGHCVDTATCGAEALAVFEPHKFDLVFTDFLMPSMTGEKLAAEIKTRCPGQPVVMLTGYPEKIQQSGHPLTAVDFLIGKPFEIESLRQAIIQFAPSKS
jgi:CheY-like chemotaxis protein